MTAQQIQWISEIEREIQILPDGAGIKVYRAKTIIRLQHKEKNCHRLISIIDQDDRELIQGLMMSAFSDICKELKGKG